MTCSTAGKSIGMVVSVETLVSLTKRLQGSQKGHEVARKTRTRKVIGREGHASGATRAHLIGCLPPPGKACSHVRNYFGECLALTRKRAMLEFSVLAAID